MVPEKFDVYGEEDDLRAYFDARDEYVATQLEAEERAAALSKLGRLWGLLAPCQQNLVKALMTVKMKPLISEIEGEVTWGVAISPPEVQPFSKP